MRHILKGSTDQSVVIRIIDSTAGVPEEAVEHDTTGISLWYRREGAAKVSITPVALAALTTAHTDGGIEHIDDGYYRLDPPDAAFASGADGVLIGGTVTDMIIIGCYVHLVDLSLSGQSAIDLKDFADDGYDPSTNEVNATVDTSGLALETTAQAIKTKTDNLPSDPADHSLVIAATDAIYNRIGAPAGPSIADDIANIDGGGDGSGFTAIPWNSAWDPEVQSEVQDALDATFDSARSEPGQGNPPESATALEKIDYNYKLAINKRDQTATEQSVYNFAGTEVDHKASTTDDGSTYTRGKFVTGP